MWYENSANGVNFIRIGTLHNSKLSLKTRHLDHGIFKKIDGLVLLALFLVKKTFLLCITVIFSQIIDKNDLFAV